MTTEINWLGFTQSDPKQQSANDLSRDWNAMDGHCLMLLAGALVLWSRVPMEVAG